MREYIEISDFLNMEFVQIKVSDFNRDITFYNSDGEKFRMFHEQDCCEDVYLADIVGDLKDIMHSPILRAEESSNSGNDDEYESFTWTYYKLATRKGYVDLRWFGSSNGYYGESVSIVKE
jgi:hypothetical protein